MTNKVALEKRTAVELIRGFYAVLNGDREIAAKAFGEVSLWIGTGGDMLTLEECAEVIERIAVYGGELAGIPGAEEEQDAKRG